MVRVIDWERGIDACALSLSCPRFLEMGLTNGAFESGGLFSLEPFVAHEPGALDNLADENLGEAADGLYDDVGHALAEGTVGDASDDGWG